MADSPFYSAQPQSSSGPTRLSDEIGSLDDSVRLILNGDVVLLAESWEIHESVLAQPAIWSIRLGWGDVARDILKLYPPRTPFALYIGGNLQFSGKTDARGATQPIGGATEIEIRGRDALAPIHDTYVRAQVGVNVATYAQLAWFALQQCGIVPNTGGAVAPGVQAQSTSLGHRTVEQILAASTQGSAPNATTAPKAGSPGANGQIDPAILRTDNAANRTLKGGVPITSILPHRTVEQILEDVGVVGNNAAVVHTTPTAKLNETWHHFLRRYFDRAGLMFFASADGTFVLTAPDGSQQPTYLLRRNTGEPNTGANVLGMEFLEDATHRHSEVVVYGRGGNKSLGRVKAKGGFTDDEMIAFGYQQALVVRDANVHSPAEAAFFARRKLAEERRNGFRLEYTVAGHTLPWAQGSATDRAVIVPDTVVQVEDDELGIHDHFYIESVSRRRSPQTTTTIRMMRVEDLVFAAPDEEE